MPDAPDLSLEHRIAGVLIPVFALRSEHDQGIGDVGTLRRFIGWAADAGFALVQLLPINETGGDNSPYNAISSMALDPTTLELTPAALPDLPEAVYRQVLGEADLAGMRAGPVQYARVKRLKLHLLKHGFEHFLLREKADPARFGELAAFQASQAAWLDTYVLFRALMDENGGTECWDRWPAPQQTAASARAWLAGLPVEARAALRTKMRFYAYVQWTAYRQWEQLKEYAGERGVALMGDIPLGVSYYSADYYGSPEIFEADWSGGAPPEPYFKDDAFTQKWGQNWGIPVYDWAHMRRDDYAWWRQRIGGVRDLFHVFRIDHILGFYRIYSFPWRPDRNAEFLPLDAEEAYQSAGRRLPQFKPHPDDTWEHREANRVQGDTLLRMVLDAAGETRLIGEDLGTVPEYVRPNLTALGIAGFKIPIWESDPHTGELLPGADYARLSLATYGTHDHEPLRALWQRWQLAPPEERAELWKLVRFAGIPPEEAHGGFTDAVLTRLLEALFRSNSWIAICMITDLLARDERFNVPGTSADSNWSQRMHVTVEALGEDPEQRQRTAACRALLERTGRRLPQVSAGSRVA